MAHRAFLYTFLTAAILVAGAGFFADIKNTGLYGGVDLRNRVTAARVASELHKDPYTYKWSRLHSDRYLDPADNITIPYARVTVPPTVLLFHNLISDLPYRTERWIWFAFQWAALIASLALLGRCIRQIPRSEGLRTTPFMKGGINNEMFVWIFGLLFIAGSSFWRLHVERGQIYIWYVLLFSAAIYFYSKGSTVIPALGLRSHFGEGGQAGIQQKESGFRVKPGMTGGLMASGLILGYLISLRPPFVFALIPFILVRKFKFASFAAGSALISVFFTGLFFPFSLWKSYYASTSFQGAMRAFPDIHYESPGVDVAEGMNIVQFLNVPGEDSSLQRIVHAITDVWPDGATLAIALLITVAILAFMLYRRGRGETADDTNSVFLAAITFVMLSELFIPAPRWPYADVIWLIPIALLVERLSTVPRGAMRSTIIGLALTGLFLNTGLHGVAKLTLLGEYLFIGGLVIAICHSGLDPESRTPALDSRVRGNDTG